ncbi:MAG: DegT/DnrJ/EryC1/StrS family aminotransferase [Ignavibacteria bacterium]|nr:DegT/DnrJ/EryC1/StrS family aminotransferase [Ignavibacteria bacterium]
MRSKWISLGPKTIEFENRFAEALGSPYAVALTNCTSALHLSMLLTGIQKGDEVIVPSLTFCATVNCVKYVDATPVFCDIKSEEDLNMDVSKLKKLITPKTKAIIAMHYGGFANDMDEIVSLAEKHGIEVIEDACHAPLSEYKGKKLGTIGEIGCFSFFSNKNISTGEGGMLVTSNSDLYERAKLLRSHGMTSLSYERSKGHNAGYDVHGIGYNYRLDDIRASIGLVQLSKLRRDLLKRKKVRERYLKKLSRSKKINIPFRDRKEFVSNYIFTVVLKNSDREKRDYVRSRLYEKGIQTSVHYPAVHRLSSYKKYKVSLPVTEYVSENEITLPMFSGLKNDEVDYVSESLMSII